MKLNYKRTIFVGFAFFQICAFCVNVNEYLSQVLANI